MDVILPTANVAEALNHPLVVALLEESSDGALVIDATDRRILAMNATARTLLGYRADEPLGCQCKAMMNSPACTLSCPLTALLSGRGRARLPLYYRGRDGASMLHAETRMLLLRAPDGTPLAGVELFRDVREQRRLESALGERRGLHGIVGAAPCMQELYALVEQIAPYDLPVLLTGESGTGKERFADAIVHLSERAARPHIKVNCAALTPSLVESELFGHKRGAFTGANHDRAGMFEEAYGGTLFLDEVGELPLPVQAKLLRVLQEGELTRVGEDRPRRVDVRLIAATNRDLRVEIEAGRFREDLFYRIAGVTLSLPPLRARREDIPLLAAHILRGLAQDTRRHQRERPVGPLSEEAMARLLTHPFRGNVRELVNVLRLAWIRTPGGRSIEVEALGLDDAGAHEAWGREPTLPPLRTLAALEAEAVRAAMAAHGGNMAAAARSLGIDRSTLWRKWGQLAARREPGTPRD